MTASGLFARPATVPSEVTLANVAEALELPEDAHGDDVLLAVRALLRRQRRAAAIVLRLPFTRPPVTANEARGGQAAHWSKQNRAKREVAHAVVTVVRQARVPHLDRVAITLTWYAPDHHERDCDGLYPMLKAVIDALTPPQPAIPKGAPTKAGTPRKQPKAAKLGAGILDGDHAGIVESTTTRIVQGDADPRIELALHPLPATTARSSSRATSPRRPSRIRRVSRPARRKTPPRVVTLDHLHERAHGQTSPQTEGPQRARPIPEEIR